jgi:hypothetical protein
MNIFYYLADALSERQTSMYSPPTGYKMCARLYLQDDGNAQHTHLFVFCINAK